MKNVIRTLAVLGGMSAIILSFAACAAAPEKLPEFYVQYRVEAASVAIVSAVTPYDSDPQTSRAFLGGFHLGLERTVAGKPPLMIEWMETPMGRASHRGYDFGLTEGERYLENSKEPGALRTAPIPPVPLEKAS